MDEVDGWSAFSARYEEDVLLAFAEFVEQVELALQLLEEGSRSRVRMALTELHSLADILLYRRAQDAFRAGEGGTYHEQALFFTRPERRELERSFNHRVQLATEPVGGLFPYRLDPLLDDAEAEVFRIAHAYRNPAYHRGEQNPATLPLITRIFLSALTQAWSRSQPPIGVERRRWDAVGDRLAAVDQGGGFVRLDHAASRIAAQLCGAAVVGLAELGEKLGDDLLMRVRAVGALLTDLDRDGLDRERMTELLAWAEMFDQLQAERDIIDLEVERRALARQLTAAFEGAEAPPQKTYRTYADLQNGYAARVFATWQSFKPKLSLTMVERIPSRIAGMRKLTTAAAVLRRYRQLDEQMESVERHLWAIARSWDEHIQQETDRVRGK